MIFKEYKKLNLSKISDEILVYWKNQDIFKKSVEQSKDKNPFIFLRAHHLQMAFRVFIMFWQGL